MECCRWVQECFFSKVLKQKPQLSRQKPYRQTSIAQINHNDLSVSIKLHLIDGRTQSTKVDQSMSILQLKDFIYHNITKQLPPKLMNLYVNQTKLNQWIKIQSLLPSKGSMLTITQKKVDLVQVSKIMPDTQRQDPLTCQKGTVTMSCGHFIGRDSMTMLIRSLIQKKQFQIKCPNYKVDQTPCNEIWDFKYCKKIGVFTKKELNDFQAGLSLNLINKKAKPCPKCKFTISKGSMDGQKMYCPNCETPFCFNCLEEWKGSDQKMCGNKDCNFYSTLLSTCEWNKVFTLAGKNGQSVQYKTPMYRSCIHCKQVIKHEYGCKHMKCSKCKKSFCWVCLSVPLASGYKCGFSNQYCGFVAAVQSIV